MYNLTLFLHSRHHLILFTLCLYILCNSACVTSKTENYPPQIKTTSILEDIQNRDTLKVGTTGDFMPFSYKSKLSGNTFQGIDIELAKDLANSLNVRVQFIQTTWPDMMMDLKNNKFDLCMSGVTIKLNRQKSALFSIPLLSSGKAAITRDENADTYTSISTINHKDVKVIVNPGGTNESFARSHFPQATILVNEDNLSIFQKIVDGKADVMVTDAVETQIQELIHPELEAVNPNEPFNFFQMGYLLPIDHTFKAYVDQWLNLRLNDGTYEKIYNDELNKIKINTSRKKK